MQLIKELNEQLNVANTRLKSAHVCGERDAMYNRKPVPHLYADPETGAGSTSKVAAWKVTDLSADEKQAYSDGYDSVDDMDRKDHR